MDKYKGLEEELNRGTPPEVLCATCPWDRLCIQPPEMTSQEVQRRIDEATQRDESAKGQSRDGFPVQSLLTAITLGGRDRMGTMCPVFALKLRSPEGRQLADSVRQIMRGEES